MKIRYQLKPEFYFARQRMLEGGSRILPHLVIERDVRQVATANNLQTAIRHELLRVRSYAATDPPLARMHFETAKHLTVAANQHLEEMRKRGVMHFVIERREVE